MALRWDWNEKIGELQINSYGEDFTISLYEGNALAIFIHTFTDENGTERYNLYNFFSDKEHFKNCIKEKSWNYAEDWRKLTLYKIPTDFWIILKDLVKQGIPFEYAPKTEAKESEK